MADIQQVCTWLQNFANSFVFTRPGVDQNLGRDMANVQVQRILARCADHEAPDGSIWLGNSDTPSPRMPNGYKMWKFELYGWEDEPNARTGQMLSKMSMGGGTVIAPQIIRIAYGTNQPPTKSYSPTGYFDEETDGQPTDLEKAEWAHMEGPHRPARPFFGVGKGDAEALVDCAQNNLNDYIRSAH
jgi:hypothetical protein